MYPQITIDINKLHHNLKTILEMCHDNHIDKSMIVVKVLAGDLSIVKEIAKHDFAYLADSRLENLREYRHLNKKKALLRLPELSEIDQVIRYADLSLNSEYETIRQLNEAAMDHNTTHEILLMFDLGDLREGIFYSDDYLPLVEKILALKGIDLKGIGTNLTCYGGLIPTREVLERLVEIKRRIERRFAIHLEIVSGGNSSSFHLFGTDEIPEEINSLRYGEVLFMGRETAYGTMLEGLNADIFTLQAELIEVKMKPSYPRGDIGMNSFGEVPKIIDKGIMKRGILAIGKQDVILENLFPKDKGVTIVGGSSDHLIVDLGNTDYVLGDILEFDVNYPGLLHLMNSRYVDKKYL